MVENCFIIIDNVVLWIFRIFSTWKFSINSYNVATSCREKEKLVHSVTLININYTDRNEFGRKLFYLEFYYLLLLTALYFGYLIYFLLGNFL